MSQVFLEREGPREHAPQDKVPTEVFPLLCHRENSRLLTQITWIHVWVALAACRDGLDGRGDVGSEPQDGGLSTVSCR